MGKLKTYLGQKKDLAWLYTWLGALVILWVWNLLFLNAPARKQVMTGFINTIIICTLVIIITLLWGWVATLVLHYFRSHRVRSGYLLLTFILNLIRSVPQIVGVLFGYIIITRLLGSGVLRSNFPFSC
jgi:ABC-type phosphate transport system permease subunit